MPPTFVRRKGDEPKREFRFLKTLNTKAKDYLEKKTLGQGYKSGPVRLRPELLDVIDTLRDRYKVNEGVYLNEAEVIAAALVEAMSGMTAKAFSLPKAESAPIDCPKQ